MQRLLVGGGSSEGALAVALARRASWTRARSLPRLTLLLVTASASPASARGPLLQRRRLSAPSRAPCTCSRRARRAGPPTALRRSLAHLGKPRSRHGHALETRTVLRRALIPSRATRSYPSPRCARRLPRAGPSPSSLPSFARSTVSRSALDGQVVMRASVQGWVRLEPASRTGSAPYLRRAIGPRPRSAARDGTIVSWYQAARSRRSLCFALRIYCTSSDGQLEDVALAAARLAAAAVRA